MNRNTKKLIVFMLFAFIPMIGVGIAVNALGGTPSIANADQLSSVANVNALLTSLITAAAMFLPMLAVIFTQLIFKEPIFNVCGISFKLNRWWVIGLLLIPVLSLATLGVSLLMPGAKWAADSELIQLTLSQLPEGIGLWGFIAITMLSGMMAGLTINGICAFGEEVGWRGFLMQIFKGKKFLCAALWIGIIWGFWHAPIILNGHNYPQHPVIGVFMMVVFCLLMTAPLMYFRIKSGSVLVPAIMHGAFNGVAGLSILLVSPINDLLYGATGLAGCLVLLAFNICLFVYDRYVSKENIFTKVLA